MCIRCIYIELTNSTAPCIERKEVESKCSSVVTPSEKNHVEINEYPEVSVKSSVFTVSTGISLSFSSKCCTNECIVGNSVSLWWYETASKSASTDSA